MELGIVIPSIRIRDNIQLKSNQYVFKIYGIEKANGEVLLDHFLVLNPDDRVELEGHETVEPTFGLPAIWIPKKEKEKAEVAGYTVIEPPAIIATHLMEVLKNNAHKLLDRQKTQQMLDHLKETHPAVVEGVIPDMVSLGTLTQILKNLLKEKIPIRNMVKIIETIADYAAYTKEPDVLTEYVRKALSETITDYLKQGENKLPVITFDPRLEDHIMSAVKEGNGESQNLGLQPNQVQEIFNVLNQKKEEIVMEGSSPILLVSPPIRRAVRNFTEPVLPDLHVVAYSELTPDTEIKSLGTIGAPNEN
jgi:flagellar biosynthesis protein FlhA